MAKASEADLDMAIDLAAALDDLTHRCATMPEAAQKLEDWHEDDGPALWWRFPINEPPYCGHPNCDDWPGYHTHWTPLVVPDAPAVAVAAEAA